VVGKYRAPMAWVRLRVQTPVTLGESFSSGAQDPTTKQNSVIDKKVPTGPFFIMLQRITAYESNIHLKNIFSII